VSDLGDVRASINAINSTQNALRETQIEQGRTLTRIADAAAVLVTGQAALAESVRRHDELLGQVVAGQSVFTDRVSRRDHLLDQLVAGQAELLRRLPVTGPDEPRD
jgi:hypothetical protein